MHCWFYRLNSLSEAIVLNKSIALLELFDCLKINLPDMQHIKHNIYSMALYYDYH